MHDEPPPEAVLAPEAVRAWLAAVSGQLVRGVQQLEAAEPWTLDGDSPRFFAAVTRLAQILYETSKPVQDESHWADLVLVLAYTSTGRSLRVMSLAGERMPGFGERLARHALDLVDQPLAPAATVILSRLKTLIRLECYYRVFGEERRRRALDILETLRNQDGRLPN